MKNKQPFLRRVTTLLRGPRARRTGELADIRQELQRRGVAIDRISDGELEEAIVDGQRVLGSASVRGSDVTGAFVVLVRSQEKL